MTGEIVEGYGPYRLINSVPSDLGSGELKPALILQVEEHYSPTDEDVLAQLHKGKTDDSLYHGGGLDDEIAALISLALGIRCRAGGIRRLFRQGESPRGRPINWMIHADPVMPLARGALRLPAARGQRALDAIKPLLLLPKLTSTDALVLVRVARIYQDALWLAEGEPELTWLLIVSAIEAAAGHWRQERESPLERLRAWGPGQDLEAVLREVGDELVTRVAGLLAPYVGARRTFVDFLLTFCPDPPACRPAPALQLDWKRGELEQTYKLIYGYRSQTLHGGRRFPAPMCDAPGKGGAAGEFAEIPFGLAAGIKGGVWVRDDTRIILHAFEDIARRALIGWWNWLAARPSQRDAT